MAQANTGNREHTVGKEAKMQSGNLSGLTQVDSWGIGRLRLDPFQMPHKVNCNRNGEQSFTVDRQGAVIEHRIANGAPVSVSLPSKAFKGVAAKACENEDGSTSVSLCLLHEDSELSIPLLVTDNLDDVAADWHAWSRMLRLPMLVLDNDNSPLPVRNQLGDIMVETPSERRKRYTTVRRRPRFLKRRKMGNVGPVERISAREIIARS